MLSTRCFVHPALRRPQGWGALAMICVSVFAVGQSGEDTVVAPGKRAPIATESLPFRAPLSPLTIGPVRRQPTPTGNSGNRLPPPVVVTETLMFALGGMPLAPSGSCFTMHVYTVRPVPPGSEITQPFGQTTCVDASSVKLKKLYHEGAAAASPRIR